MLTVFLTAGLLAATAGRGHAQFVAYDDFSSGAIDPEKWYAVSAEGAFASPTAQAIRTVDNSGVRLALTSWGDNTSDSGAPAQSSETIRIRQLGALGGSGFITGLRAKVTVLAADAQHCPANAATVNSISASRARALLQMDLFNDGRGGPGDSTGNVRAEFDAWQNRDGANQIIGHLEFCTTAACAVTVFANTNFFTHSWSVGTPLVLEIAWDEANAMVSFAVKDPVTLAAIETRSVGYSGLANNAGPPTNVDAKQLRVVNTVENCLAGRKHASMDARFTDIAVRRRP
jgi:hypothetical protein